MDRPGILVTRPAAQAGGLASVVEGLGYKAILAPCLERRLIAGPPLDLAGLAAIAVTSANGVAALAARTSDRSSRLIAVGDASAAAAQAAGFTSIESADGDGAALADYIVAKVGSGAGQILHLSGAEAAIDLAALLRPYGIDVARVVGYAMEPAADFPAQARAALRAREVAAVLLMSARTAEAFGVMAAVAHVSGALANAAAICLSAAVAEAARPLGFGLVAEAKRPTQSSLLACLCAVVAPR